MHTLDDDPLFDPIVSTDSDYNQSDSQELVADYDDRPDAAYTSQSAPAFIPNVSNLQQNEESSIHSSITSPSAIYNTNNNTYLKGFYKKQKRQMRQKEKRKSQRLFNNECNNQDGENIS